MKKNIKIHINYDQKTITLGDEHPICVKKRKDAGKMVFDKAGAGYYLAFFESMILNCYPCSIGRTITLDNVMGGADKPSRYPNSLNFTLPDYLNIVGTNAFSFDNIINDYLLEVEVTCTKVTAIEQRQTFHKLLGEVNWEEKNEENRQWYDKSHNIDVVVPTIVVKKDGINCVRWEEEKIKKAICEVELNDIDFTLIPKIEKFDCTLAEYVDQNCMKRFGANRISIIRGENGYGKTYSMYNTAHAITNAGHIVLFVPAYKLKEYEQSISRYILKKYIGASLSDISGREAIVMLLNNLPKGKKVIIMIDGLDELPHRYYRQLIVDDMEFIFQHNESVYFVASTRNSNSFIEKGEISIPFTELDLKRIDPKETDLSDRVKVQLKECPLLCTPIILSIFKRIEKGLEKDSDKGLAKYGVNLENISELKNETDIFEIWMRMLSLHAERVGQRGYIYSHLLTYTAYNCFLIYLKREERYDLDRTFFKHATFSDGLEKCGMIESRNYIYPESIEELISMFQSTGLMKSIDKGEKVTFKNIEYMLYLAAKFKVLLFKGADKKKREKMIDEIITLVERGSDVRFRTMPYAFHFFNIMMKEYSLNTIALTTEELSKLMAIGLEIGYERTYDVQDNIKELILWFKQSFDEIRGKNKLLWCKLVYNINAVIHNMTVQWHHVKEPEKLLNYVKIQLEWIKRLYEHNLGWFEADIADGLFPIDFKEMIIGNMGAVNQEFAKYYRSQQKKSGYSIINEYMRKSVDYHMLAYKNRIKMLGKGVDSKKMEIGVSRSIISLSTDHFYLGLFHDIAEPEQKKQYFDYAIYGKKDESGVTVPGYIDALNMQGTFSYSIERNQMTWRKRSEQSLYECEPFMIFRRMAGCYFEKWKIGDATDDNILFSVVHVLNFASSELLQDCMIDDKLSTELLNKYKNEINAFKNDLEKKYIVMLLNVNMRKAERNMLLESYERIIKLYNRINNSNVTLKQMKEDKK